MPFEVQGHTVPHLKALISGNLEQRQQVCGYIFIFFHAFLKKAILLHKEAYHADLFSSHCTLFFFCFVCLIGPWITPVMGRLVFQGFNLKP